MKKSKRIIRDFIATGCAAALALGGAAPAFAGMLDTGTATAYTLPTSETPLTDTDGYRYGTTIGAHGSAVVGEYAGLSLQVNQSYATTGNGVSTTNYVYNPYYGIYGSSANENPDPYAANLFYNWYVKATSATEAAAEAAMSDDYMYNYIWDGYSGSAFVSDNKTSVGGTNRALSGRPDVLVLKGTDEAKSNFANYIQTIHGLTGEYKKAASDTYVGDENYDPYIAGYKETHLPDLVTGVYDTANAANDAVAQAQAKGVKVKLRYGDPVETAKKYEKLVRGSNLYVLAKIADGTIKRKTVAFVTSISGSGADATVTLASSVDPVLSGEQTHNIEPTVATCDNLADILYKEQNGSDIERGAKSTSVTCTVADLAKADAILLTNPDNIAYHLSSTGSSSWTYSCDKDYAEDTAKSGYRGLDEEDGSDFSRYCVGAEGKTYYKNQYYGPMAWTETFVSNIKDALNAEGSSKAKALAKKSIMSCVGENASAQDGGSVDSMDLQPIINAFVYPELDWNQVEELGYFMDQVAHIKTGQVGSITQILAQDMSLADGAKLSDVSGYSASTAKAIEGRYNEGIRYYFANKAAIDAQYPWLTLSANITEADAAKYANTLTATGKTAKVKYSKLKKKAQTLAASKVLTVKKAVGKVTYKKTSGSKKITVNSKTGKVTIKKNAIKKGKTATIKIKVTAAGDGSYKSASKTATVKIKATK